MPPKKRGTRALGGLTLARGIEMKDADALLWHVLYTSTSNIVAWAGRLTVTLPWGLSECTSETLATTLNLPSRTGALGVLLHTQPGPWGLLTARNLGRGSEPRVICVTIKQSYNRGCTIA